jgi:hypothetical protein
MRRFLAASGALCVYMYVCMHTVHVKGKHFLPCSMAASSVLCIYVYACMYMSGKCAMPCFQPAARASYVHVYVCIFSHIDYRDRCFLCLNAIPHVHGIHVQ